MVAAVLLGKRRDVERRGQAGVLDLAVEERLARAVREQLEQRAHLHPRPRGRQRQHLELRRLGIGRVYLAQRDRHGNRQRRDLADENARVISLDRTDVHGKSPQIMYTNTLTGPNRKSVVEGKSVSVRLDLGGRRIIK